jgi:hypothetical protein
MTTINWKIQQLDRRTEDGFVTTAHWTCSVQDDKYTSGRYGFCLFDGQLVTPYENLTEQQVLEWVWEKIDKNEIELSIAAEIEIQKNPVTASGIPW